MKGIALVVLAAHVIAGFIGMYGGLVPPFVRKGGGSHRRWGRVFTWALGAAVVPFGPFLLESRMRRWGSG
ncbi:MAG: hypothetical protein ACO1SV_14480 [Fimbriimonas sp.]